MNKSISRKGFIKSAGITGMAALFRGLSIQNEPASLPDSGPDLVLNSTEGEVYLIGERQGRVTIKVDKRNKGVETMSLLTEDIKPNDGIPVHKHGSEEEFIYIERGSGILTFGDKEYEVNPGSMALVPRGVWHGLRNEETDLLRMVFAYTPAGFEDYFRAIGVKPGKPAKQLTGEDWARINNNFGIIYRG